MSIGMSKLSYNNGFIFVASGVKVNRTYTSLQQVATYCCCNCCCAPDVNICMVNSSFSTTMLYHIQRVRLRARFLHYLTRFTTAKQKRSCGSV